MRHLRLLASRLLGAIADSRSLRGGMLGLIVCLCTTLMATAGLQLWRVHETNMHQADVVAANTARSLAEQAEATMKTADTIAATLVDRAQADGMGPDALLRFYGLMTSLAKALPAIHEMGIVNRQGDAVVKSLTPDTRGLNYADRQYFQFHASHPGNQGVVGPGIRSKIDRTANITVSHRIDGPDGSFAGVVVTSVSLGYFQRLFDEIQAKSGGTIALVADDDAVLARSPMPTDAHKLVGSLISQRIGAHAGAGSITYVSNLDGVRRRGSYMHLQNYPLTVLVGQSVWDLQRGWREEVRSQAIILGCFMVAVVALGRRAFKASRMLNALATHDALTGLANRRSFDSTIEREFRRAARTGDPVSVVMIDLDRFKAYNDHFGHVEGDACLRAVCGTVQLCLRRAGEYAARYGGEELAVVLPGYDAPSAYEVAEAIRAAVADLGLKHPFNAGHGVVTLSAGVATCVPGGGGSGWQSLVREADAALYAAKESGRDRVVTYRAVLPVRTERRPLSMAAGLP